MRVFFFLNIYWAPFISPEFCHIACPCCWNVVPASTNSSSAWKVEVYFNVNHRVFMSKVSRSPSCPLVELPDVRKVLVAPASMILWFLIGKVHWEVRVWGHFCRSDTQGCGGIQFLLHFCILLDSTMHLLTVFQLNISWVFWSYDNYLTWCSSGCRFKKMQFNHVQQS